MEAETGIPERTPHDALLLVSLTECGLHHREVRLHFDDDHRQRLAASGQDIDRTTLAKLRVGHLDGHIPLQDEQSANYLGYKSGVVLVEQSVQIASAPRDDRFPTRVERGEDLSQRGCGETGAMTSLD